jgi:hypothetical protein
MAAARELELGEFLQLPSCNQDAQDKCLHNTTLCTTWCLKREGPQLALVNGSFPGLKMTMSDMCYCQEEAKKGVASWDSCGGQQEGAADNSAVVTVYYCILKMHQTYGQMYWKLTLHGFFDIQKLPVNFHNKDKQFGRLMQDKRLTFALGFLRVVQRQRVPPVSFLA